MNNFTLKNFERFGWEQIINFYVSSSYNYFNQTLHALIDKYRFRIELSYVWFLISSRSCIAYDIDEDALEICRQNLEDCDIDNVELKQQNILDLDPADTALHDVVDTVVMNPPFGTKNNEGTWEFDLKCMI